MDTCQGDAVGLRPGLRKAIEHDTLRPFLLYGPAGTGKTVLARIIAHTTHAEFVEVSCTWVPFKIFAEIMPQNQGF